jgi:hypothetical protein
MCWSANISLGFSIFQAICLSIALFRGRKSDLLAVFAHLPVLGQEFLSFLVCFCGGLSLIVIVQNETCSIDLE